MNLAELAKYFKATKKLKRITIAGYVGNTILASDNHICVRLNEEQASKVFARRDEWPKLPAVEDATYEYDVDMPPLKLSGEAAKKLIKQWEETTDLMYLDALSIQPWVMVTKHGLLQVLNAPKGTRLYLDYDKLLLISPNPLGLRFYTRGEGRQCVLCDQGNQIFGLLPFRPLGSLEEYSIPTIDGECADYQPRDIMAEALDDLKDDLKAHGMTVIDSKDGEE